MKTKRFLLATSGATVDGRTIEAEHLRQMAQSYDPKVYSARLNIEHIRGISGEGPFRAYGDVLSLEVEDVTVTFNGKPEQRVALYGVFDVTEDAKALNDAGQKLYPSIEIHPNFADKGYAYLMGCALTDSPASIATERLEFTSQLSAAVPGIQRFSREEAADAALLEFDTPASPEATGLLSGLKGVLDNFADRFAPKTPAPATTPAPAEPAAPPAGFTAEDLRTVFTELATSIDKSITALRQETRDATDALAVKVNKLEQTAETTAPATFRQRPESAGTKGNYVRTDC
ncbi:MAG: GPO family capsid scaffolding protein [Porphyrobacter sp.]|nr:GPO family capsid scaffolding protein [Porphyrobacter sp.]